MPNRKSKAQPISESGNAAKLPVRRPLPITDAEYKKLMKSLYPVDKSRKFRRQ